MQWCMKRVAHGARWAGTVAYGVWVSVLVGVRRTKHLDENGELKEEYRDRQDEWNGGNRWL